MIWLVVAGQNSWVRCVQDILSLIQEELLILYSRELNCWAMEGSISNLLLLSWEQPDSVIRRLRLVDGFV